MISKTIFRLIDGLILCANKLCGIDPVSFEGEDTDLLSYLLFSGEVGFAFRVTAILATILLVVFAVFMIIRTIAKDKAEGTPAQIAVKTFKTLLMFLFVPTVMIAFMTIGNAFISALYYSTLQNASTPGGFLFCAFAVDGGMDAEIAEQFKLGAKGYSYIDTNVVSSYMDLSEFPFFFSWLAGGVTLFSIASAMLIFIDRILSIVILYIVSPISISTSVIDDGARFKLWRDQFLSKFIMGYGMILAINIYAMVCGIVMRPGFEFFTDDSFLDLIMKLLVIAGGALTLQKSMALIGNLVASGAGSNELRDNLSAGKLAGMAATGAFAPLKALAKGYSAGKKEVVKKHEEKEKAEAEAKKKAKGGESDSKNDGKANYSSNGDATKDAINNDSKFELSKWPKKDDPNGGGNGGGSNTNNNQPKPKGNDMMADAINNKTNGNTGNNGNTEETPKQEGVAN